MKEIHGVVARKVEHAFADDERTVRIIDSEGSILIGMGFTDLWAKLTPEEARFIAKQLVDSAKRVEVK